MVSRPRQVARLSPLRRSLVGSTWEGILAMPLVYLNLPANLVVATLLAEALLLPPDTYGLLVSIPFWCNLAQLGLAPLLFARYRARDVFLVTIWLNTAVWTAFAGVLAFAPATVMAHPGLIAGFFLLAGGLTTSVMAVAWTTYMQSWVPPRIRAVYFARRNRAAQFSNLAFLLLSGLALQWPTLPVIAAIFAVSTGLRAVSAVVAWRTPAQGEPVSPTATDWRTQWTALRGADAFWRMVVFGVAWGAVVNGFGAFQPVFMLSVLGGSAAQASLPLALSLLFGAMAMPAWGRLIARFGARPVLFCAVPLWALVNVPWAFLTSETRFLLYPLWAFTGAVNGGIVLAQFNLLMKFMPPSVRGLAAGCNIAAASLGTALAPIIAGQLIALALARGWAHGTVYHAFFMLMPVGAGVALLLLRRVREPQAAPVEHVVGALRNVRTLAGTLGLGFLAQTLFTPRGADRRVEY
ncbi:MAG: MFS transporter [Candidatus Didemnitutus sp.]|nr:MFS transporter [Candidatus Didemnitutus sp.]